MGRVGRWGRGGRRGLRRSRRASGAGVVLVVAFVVSGCLAPRTTAAMIPTWCADQSAIVVLGDSHSTGYRLPDYPGGGAFEPTGAGWTSTVLRRASDEWGTVTTVLAHNGALAADFRPGGRWPETTSASEYVHDVQPALVIVALGANEFASDLAPTEFDEHYRGLVAELQRASPRSAVLLLVPPEMGARLVPDPVYSWDAYTAVIETVAAEKGAELLDLGQYLPPGGTPEAEGLYLADAAHLTEAGHRVVHAAVWTFLEASCAQ
ncbi:SGNH/GDSL hydrolase family protein [Saccharomonospora azurea]